MKLKRLFALLATVTGLIAVSGTGAGATDWPTKPVRIVVPYAAGGAADTLARVFGEVLGTAFGKQFYIDNRTGGGSLVGTEAAAHSDPDGYTFVMSGMAPDVLAPAMNKNAGFDPMRDFTHVAYFGGAPNIFVVHPSFGSKTFKDFLAQAKSQKDGIDYVSPGVGSVGNLVAEYLAAKENIKLVHVAYKGGAGALLDLVAGHVKVGLMSYSTAAEHIRAGSLIPIAVSSEKRLPDFPDVPTLKELGYPDLVATTWWSLSAPTGTPKDITDKVNQEINKSFTLPQVVKSLKQDAVESKAMTPEEVTQYMQSEIDKWGSFVKKMNVAAP
jgi:tripartite-type tricarboxylate transporter receptor subunit TctC